MRPCAAIGNRAGPARLRAPGTAQSMFSRAPAVPVICAGGLSAFRIRRPGLRKQAGNAPETAECFAAGPGRLPAAARVNHGTELATRGPLSLSAYPQERGSS